MHGEAAGPVTLINTIIYYNTRHDSLCKGFPAPASSWPAVIALTHTHKNTHTDTHERHILLFFLQNVCTSHLHSYFVYRVCVGCVCCVSLELSWWAVVVGLAQYNYSLRGWNLNVLQLVSKSYKTEPSLVVSCTYKYQLATVDTEFSRIPSYILVQSIILSSRLYSHQ